MAMFWSRKPSGTAAQVRDLTPEEVHAALLREEILLVDVREPQEHAAERIEGSLLAPLSRFDPSSLPVGDKQVVLYCAVGRRSATAVAACAGAGVPVTMHLAGGLRAWTAAGLPTVK
jgi:rhodanese-related sulfurtransferase